MRTKVVAAVAGALLATASLAAAAPEKKGLEIYWIDVEGGAATLIVTPAGEPGLVDTGWPGPRDPDRIHEARPETGAAPTDPIAPHPTHGDPAGGAPPRARR